MLTDGRTDGRTTDGRTTDGRTTDGRTTDARVTGILIAHLGAFGSGELINLEKSEHAFLGKTDFSDTVEIRW